MITIMSTMHVHNCKQTLYKCVEVTQIFWLFKQFFFIVLPAIQATKFLGKNNDGHFNWSF